MSKIVNKIVTYPDPSLQVKQDLVKSWDEESQKVADSLKNHLSASKEGIGLAAPQIGKKGRIIVIKSNILSLPNLKTKDLVIVNPKILKTFGKKEYSAIEDHHGEKENFLEGCLSVPEIYGPVKRWLKINAFWQEPNKKGLLEDKEAVLEGMGAIVFQHELDHLNGILFIDHLKKEKSFLGRD